MSGRNLWCLLLQSMQGRFGGGGAPLGCEEKTLLPPEKALVAMAEPPPEDPKAELPPPKPPPDPKALAKLLDESRAKGSPLLDPPLRLPKPPDAPPKPPPPPPELLPNGSEQVLCGAVRAVHACVRGVRGQLLSSEDFGGKWEADHHSYWPRRGRKTQARQGHSYSARPCLRQSLRLLARVWWVWRPMTTSRSPPILQTHH